jgi:hypothetical protein
MNRFNLLRAWLKLIIWLNADINSPRKGVAIGFFEMIRRQMSCLKI